MKFAVFSDIHANNAALEAALVYLSKINIDKMICLGDIVGYGPHPNECVQHVAENCHTALMGNHDHAVLGKTSTRNFNEYAKTTVAWTQKQLTPENRSFLEAMPFSYSERNLLFVHSTPGNHESWNYILNELDAMKNFQEFSEKICFIGHSHFPVIFSQNAGKIQATKLRLKLAVDRYIINVGSLGQPRDGNPDACLATFDTETDELEFHRIKYDIQKTYSDLIGAGLPQFLAMRLLAGH